MTWTKAMQVALNVAALSPDPSTQNGACLAEYPFLDANNRFPGGVAHTPERWERPLKYKFVEHAERNVIYRAARSGVATQGLTLVCAWAACSDCARAIVQAGIKRLVRIPARNEATHERWHEDCEVGDVIMQEGGVEIVEFVDLDALDIPRLRRNGEVWDPRAVVA